MKKIRVLFVCVHNSGRSQMAEAWLQALGEDRFEVESAGLEPGSLNPLAVEVMAEAGIDISGNSCDSVFAFLKQQRRYNYVITVCDESNGERCPLFPGMVRRQHWSFQDPASLSGTKEQQLEQTRLIREQIRMKVTAFIEETHRWSENAL